MDLIGHSNLAGEQKFQTSECHKTRPALSMLAFWPCVLARGLYLSGVEFVNRFEEVP